MLRKTAIFIILISISIGASAEIWDTKSDTWVATDALGRSLPGYAECGPPRSDRIAGIFYLLWLGQHGTDGPYDITKILAANPTDPQYGPMLTYHHWAEPELGYYLSSDPYVMRRHCQMLVAAGIDVVFLDVTNGWTYTSNYLTLCSVYRQIQSEGGKTPQICFMSYWSDTMVQALYNEFYSQNLYSELWFRWQGKPLILAKPDTLSQTLKDFFTIRECWAWSNGGPGWFFPGPTAQDKWLFLDNHPQGYGYHTPGVPEQTAVTVAQHATTNIGRSFHDGSQPPYDQYKLCPTTAQGLCFAEQWNRALQIDPQIMFISSWNEWMAARFPSDGTASFLGGTVPAGGSVFVDSYNQEYSRDIEPMKGGHTDNYYYQMIDGIRRYKGVRAPEPASSPKTISIDGSFSDWTDVGPEFRDTIYDTTARNQAGWGSAGTYVNSTGRNDIKIAKVARDSNYIYFYAETFSGLSSYTSPNWMLLFIDSDQNPNTGWQGYDYMINSSVVSSTSTTLKRNTGGWSWTSLSNVSYRYSMNKIEIAVPRSAIGQSGGSGAGFDFHWADNIQQNGSITEFFVNGDSAPDRRFNYRYSTVPGNVINFAATVGDTQNTLTWVNPSDNSFSGTMIRYRTDTYPTSPTDGILVCDKIATPGSSDSYVHRGLTNRTYYYSAFAHDLAPNYSQAATASATPAVSVCYYEPFAYANGSLNGNGGWTGSAASQIAVDGQTLKVTGGAASYDSNRTLSCTGQNGMIWVHAKIKSGSGSNTMWNLWIDDPAGNNLARWYGSGTTARGRIGSGSQVTGAQNLTGGWDDLHVILYTASNTSEFYFNGALIGTLDHSETGAGDIVGRVRFERIDNSGAANEYVYVDDLAVGYPDVIAPSATIASPAGGVYTSGKQVILTASEVARIYFTTNGTEPTTSSSIYQTPIPLYANMTLKFFAVDPAGNAESPKRQEVYTVLSENGFIAAVKSLTDDGDDVSLAGKALYLSQGTFGYIEETDRSCGIRVEGDISAAANQLVNLTGTKKTTPDGEKYIQIDKITADGPFIINPLGANNRDLRDGLLDGMLVRAWGMVKPGSVTSNSFVITDGSDAAGIKVITDGEPEVSEGAFVTVAGASGVDGVRVLYITQNASASLRFDNSGTKCWRLELKILPLRKSLSS